MAAKQKTESSHNVEFAEGGDTPMFGTGNHEKTDHGANPQAPSHTGHDAPSGGGPKFAEGGKGKMFGFHGSQPATAGQTGAR